MTFELSMALYNCLNILVTSVGFTIIVNRNRITLKEAIYLISSVIVAGFVTTSLYSMLYVQNLKTDIFLIFYYISLCFHLFIVASIFVENHIERYIVFAMSYELTIIINILCYILCGGIYIPIYFHPTKIILWIIVVVFLKFKFWKMIDYCVSNLLMNKTEYKLSLVFSVVLLVMKMIFYIETIVATCNGTSNLMGHLEFLLLLFISIGVKFLLIHLSEKKTANTNLKHEKDAIEKKEVMLHQLDDIEMKLKIERHDQKHIFHTIRFLLEDNNTQAAMELVSNKTCLDSPPIHSINYCENDVANALLTSYFADNQDINVSVLIDMPKEWPIPSCDITTLLGNIVENAVNNCRNSNHPKAPFVELRGGIRRSNIVLVCRNSCNNYVQFKNGQPVNKNRKSYGIESVANLVNKYNGHVMYSVKDEVFTVNLILSI